MHNNITKDDRDVLIKFLKTDPILTNGPKVLEFEEAWSKWLGVKYSVFVNSGASANFLTMAYLYHAMGTQHVILPALTWISDIASVIQNSHRSTIVDISPKTLGMSVADVSEKIKDHLKAYHFVTHVMGLVSENFCQWNYLIEDCCEAHGATYRDGSKVGTKGLISNFSFYFAHHMTTVEGGMVCTNDEKIYEAIRMLRSHGMVREAKNPQLKEAWARNNPQLHPSFMFAYPGFNMRSTEINAVLGLNQLKRLDENNEKRKKNFNIWLDELSPKLYRTTLQREGAVAYALVLIMKDQNIKLRDKIERLLTLCGVEFRRGLSGGGNQLRQPYLKEVKWDPKKYPEVEHITDFSWYIGNYPDLDHKKIKDLCRLLNQF